MPLPGPGLNLGLQYAEQLDKTTRLELQQLIAAIQVWAGGVRDISQAGSFVQPRCRYFLVTPQTVANNTDTALLWTTGGFTYPYFSAATKFDNGADHSPRGQFLRVNGDWLTPPVGGQYLMLAGVSWAANAVGRREIWLERREAGGIGASFGGVSMDNLGAGALVNQQVAALVTVVDQQDPTVIGEDAVRVMVFQNSGGNLDAGLGVSATYVHLIKLS